MINTLHSLLSKWLPEKALMFVVEAYYTSLRVLLYVLRVRLMPKFIIKIFEAFGVKLFQFENIDNYAHHHPKFVEFIAIKTIDLYYSAACFDYLNFETSMLKSNRHAKQYIAILKHVTVIGGSNLMITESGKALYDLKYHNPENRYRYTDGAILADYKNDCLVKVKNSNLVFDEVIWMGANFSFSYYHLLYEVLVKFQQIETMKLDKEVPILLDKIVMDIPQYHDLLNMLNKDGRKIIPIEKGTSYLVNQLYVISCPNFIPPNFWSIKDVRAEDNLFDLSSLSYLRNSLLAYAKPLSFPKRIFLSRRKASGRRPFNEAEVFEVLERYGFVTMFPEDYSIAEQISMFNQADFIAGGSGGAFTNVLFCKPGCKLLCFSNYAFDISIFTTIAKHVEADLLYIIDESKDFSKVKNLHESFTIDLKKLDEMMRFLVK